MAGWMGIISVVFAGGGLLLIGTGALTDGLVLLLLAALLFIAAYGLFQADIDASADQAYRKCGRCGGEGQVHTSLTTKVTCPHCGGTGLESNPFYRP